MADAETIISRLSSRFADVNKDREKPNFITRDISSHSIPHYPTPNYTKEEEEKLEKELNLILDKYKKNK